MRIRTAVLAVTLYAPAGLALLPAAAEVDLAGEWANRVHEDQPDDDLIEAAYASLGS